MPKQLRHADILTIEQDAEAFIRFAGFEPAQYPTVYALSCAVLASPPVLDQRVDTGASIEPHGCGWQVRFRSEGMSRARCRICVAHELGHFWYQHTGFTGPLLEDRCDAFGAALIAPRAAVLWLLRMVGGDLAALARKLRTTESLAHLRSAEVTGRPSMLLKPTRRIVRGERRSWPPVRYEAVAAADVPLMPGIHRIAISDEPLRVGLVAA